MVLIQMLVRCASSALPAACIVLLIGCDSQGEKPLANATEQAEIRFRFEPTDASQHVVFLTEPWTGGGGQPVLVGPNAKRTLQFKDTPVFLGPEAVEVVHRGLGAHLTSHRERQILIDAKVRLVPATVELSTIIPMELKVYQVVVDELIDARWYKP